MTVIPTGAVVIDHGADRDRGGARTGVATTITVSPGGDHLHLVHAGNRPPLWLTRLADRLGPVRPHEAAVLVGVPAGEAEELCRLLAPVLEASRDAQVRLLTLVMSEGADESGGRPSAARLICERWRYDVLATAGPALITADGSLFSPSPPGTSSGWWHFSPNAPARHVSSHLPVPEWETAVWGVGRQTVAGHVVEPVAAGLAVRPLGPASPGTRARLHAVPPERGRPQLILTSPDIPAAALAVIMAALPEQIRGSLRLMSLTGCPIPRTAQEVADLLGCDVHAALGSPVIRHLYPPDGASAGDAAADQYLLDSAGRPAWRPFAHTVVHTSATDAMGKPARVTQWRVPKILSKGVTPDALPLGRHWKAAVTQAGLWLGLRDTTPPFIAVARPARADTVALDLGVPHPTADNPPWDGLWPELDTLLGQLEPEICVRAAVHVHGGLGARDRQQLLELTMRHGLPRAGVAVSGRPAPVTSRSARSTPVSG
ncbi:hypothetical protein ABTY96_46860 [Streptomyces sp. NPDC096057]|uniref:hypothetical protein n=1 Tax=Streptomyces sp. NPDC096057 TaxID=3155543 RepID=UPI00332F1D4D